MSPEASKASPVRFCDVFSMRNMLAKSKWWIIRKVCLFESRKDKIFDFHKITTVHAHEVFMDPAISKTSPERFTVRYNHFGRYSNLKQPPSITHTRGHAQACTGLAGCGQLTRIHDLVPATVRQVQKKSPFEVDDSTPPVST